MKRIVAWFIFLAAVGTAIAAEPLTIVLRGPVTNTTGDDATANVFMLLHVDGEKVTGQMKTEPPLAGTGKLEGRMLGAWCELHGKMDEGFTIQFRGAMNARDFRGTYIAAVPGEPVQYGKFQLTRETPEQQAGSTGAAEAD